MVKDLQIYTNNLKSFTIRFREQIMLRESPAPTTEEEYLSEAIIAFDMNIARARYEITRLNKQIELDQEMVRLLTARKEIVTGIPANVMPPFILNEYCSKMKWPPKLGWKIYQEFKI